ncbi:MAG: hypothetical protein NT062_30995 [Proteobacteria bacterium]|nr:hypothetical protein [Pseudomonadota bacterium]
MRSGALVEGIDHGAGVGVAIQAAVTTRHLILGALLVVGCGRVGFDTVDGRADADVPLDYVEPHGELDPSFGTAGITIVQAASLYDVEPRRAGLAVAGYIPKMAATRMLVVGLDAAGVADASFAGGGLAELGPTKNDFAYGIARTRSGLLVVAGDGDDGTATRDDLTVALLDDLGAPQASFGTGGFARVDVGDTADTANAVALVPRGGVETIMLCGSADYAAVDSHFVLANLDLRGQRVAGFGANGLVSVDFSAGDKDECNAVIARPGGGVIAVGRAGPALVVAAFTETGALDASFGAAGRYLVGATDGFGYDVIDVAGDLIVVGEEAGRAVVLRLSPDGVPRASFGTDGVLRPAFAELLAGIAVQPNGKLVVSGLVGARGVLARVDGTTGVVDPSFGTAGVLELTAGSHLELLQVELQPNGPIVVVGRIGTTDPFSGFIARVR